MNFDAPTIARAWLSVGLAAGSKDDVPAFARTVAIEEYLEGVRLVATDRYVLLTAWVPTLEHHYATEPDLDEAPDRTVVAADPDGRARSLLGYALSLAKRDGDDDPVPGDIELDLDFDVRLPAGQSGNQDTLDWAFGGPEKVAAIDLGDSDPHVTGLVMPMRWVLPGEPEPETADA